MITAVQGTARFGADEATVEQMRLVLLGRPGAGTGTQAKLIEEGLGVHHISAGDLLRSAVRQRTALGRAAKQYMVRGQLVPDDLIVKMAKDRIRDADSGVGFLLDGFPRNRAQAETLENI